MTRIAIVKREEMNADQGRVYDEAKAANAPVGGPYYAYIRNPQLFTASQNMGKAIGSFKLSARERQIAVITTARFWNAKYPWGAQVRNSLAQGVDQVTIDAINAGKTPDLPNPREAMAHKLAKELLTNKGLSEATYKEAEKLFGPEDLVGLVAAVGQFCMVSCSANAFDITPTDEMQPLKV
jgi:4-carboxymuconolactone decarboxylase